MGWFTNFFTKKNKVRPGSVKAQVQTKKNLSNHYLKKFNLDKSPNFNPSLYNNKYYKNKKPNFNPNKNLIWISNKINKKPNFNPNTNLNWISNNLYKNSNAYRSRKRRNNMIKGTMNNARVMPWVKPLNSYPKSNALTKRLKGHNMKLKGQQLQKLINKNYGNKNLITFPENPFKNARPLTMAEKAKIVHNDPFKNIVIESNNPFKNVVVNPNTPFEFASNNSFNTVPVFKSNTNNLLSANKSYTIQNIPKDRVPQKIINDLKKRQEILNERSRSASKKSQAAKNGKALLNARKELHDVSKDRRQLSKNIGIIVRESQK